MTIRPEKSLESNGGIGGNTNSRFDIWLTDFSKSTLKTSLHGLRSNSNQSV